MGSPISPDRLRPRHELIGDDVIADEVIPGKVQSVPPSAWWKTPSPCTSHGQSGGEEIREQSPAGGQMALFFLIEE